ncbi:MAG: hydantoinase/oxoprolinase family protein [Mariprofundaceae bacterium]|nr:hydantoinase/oxoprolinase family protein [Mariprofundaceae bacterium]
MKSLVLGVDTGGTFTDFVTFDGERLRFHKELSTPHNPCESILRGIHTLGLTPQELYLVHGSTVATNAILERKGVKTLFVTNRGMEDLLRIGRQTRPRLYDLCPPMPPAWVKQEDCFGISGRVNAAGTLIEPIQNADLEQLGDVANGYVSVAICTLFSFLNKEQEQAAADALPEGLFVSQSHEVLAEYREFERAVTTFLNAYVGPLVQQYLLRLADAISPENADQNLFVMHSAGGLMDVDEAGRNAIKMVLSGPAGGLVAARAVGEQLVEPGLITFDMGGTSTDVSLLDGSARITTEGHIAGLPVAMPMLDIHTIGAGGGSIAWRDEAGLLQVGPESAGSDPGPACYDQGGTQPTVTDANVVLGRIPESVKLAGNIPIDAAKAGQSVTELGKQFNMDMLEMAQGIVRVAEENMAGALRVVSVQRGHDPKSFALLCFGGAGGLHACALAEALDIFKIILPVASGAFSALGMLAGQRQCDVSQTRRIGLDDKHAADESECIFSQLEERARQRMPGLQITIERTADVRYRGQGFHLTIPYTNNMDALATQFIHTHTDAYGHTLDQPIEIITLRLRAIAETAQVCLPELSPATSHPKPSDYSGTVEAGRIPHYRREALRPGHKITGPTLILEDTATLWLAADWQLAVSPHGHLILTRQNEEIAP